MSKVKSANRAKTHCPNGHAYRKPNLIIVIDRKGRKRRVCRKCAVARSIQYYRDKVKPLHPRRPGRPWDKQQQGDVC